MADLPLPSWPEIKGNALDHLQRARVELADGADWLRGIDSPLTPAQCQAARETLALISQAKELIDEAKGALDG